MVEQRVGILGLGNRLGSKVVTNKDLEQVVDTSDEWILTRTGIKERRLIGENESNAVLASRAAKEAIKNAGIKAEELDLIIVATVSPEQPLPATACFVQRELKADNAGAFDLVAACPGWVYGLSVAEPMIKIGQYKYILVIGSDTLSTITNWEDRGTCVLFGDGAGATVLGPVEKPRGILATAMHNDPYNLEILESPGGGSRKPMSKEVLENKEHLIAMRGNELFKIAVRDMADVAIEVLEKAGLSIDDVDHVVPHQANFRITDAVTSRLKIDPKKSHSYIEKMGNNSSATIPIGLADLTANGTIKEGDIVLCTTFGAGISYAACVIRW